MRCAVEVAALRAEPHEDAEQVTQALRGEPLHVEERRNGWARVLTAYHYPGWVREDAQNHGREVLGKIAEVKVAADSAYNEANTVNHKIESIGLKLAAPGKLAPDESHPAVKE